ncbi:hypothetical protein EJ03DRAFT_348248 [Teratosphaeria nubilosa]|uniref:Uncharacterized protein n=1 Tax=Teratosphaeria nubilosa TaxID=161662 RepID=A0A6G1LKL9_9PEZI|nr:hypothetical protein EJ03DRAFT_348248 [Teratosphaeria nubilosa]
MVFCKWLAGTAHAEDDLQGSDVLVICWREDPFEAMSVIPVRDGDQDQVPQVIRVFW